MNYESDWITRQLKSFAQGLGYVFSKGKGGGETEIVFPQKQEKLLPHQDELQQLIDAHHYAQAAKRLWNLQYAMPEQDFVKLGVWFYGTLNGYSNQELIDGNYSRNQILVGLNGLKNMKE